AVVNLAAAYPSLTQLLTLPNSTFEGRTTHALRIGDGGGSRDTVMAIGGQHAREWGSCEILVNFAADLLEAYDTNAGLAYGGKSFTAAQVKTIVENMHVVVFPLVNPDGRHYSQTVDAGWRKNRNPDQSGGDPECIGVDLNRNHDFLFDFKNKLDPFAYSPQNPDAVVVSDDPCVEIYHGPSAASEAETKNVRWLLDAFPRTRWFFDVHSYGTWILRNWGDDENQSTDPDMNFRNPDYDSARGIQGDTAYKEYIPAGDELIETTMGERMKAAIQAVRGIVYDPNTSFVGLYGTTGSSKDYAYSRHFVDPSKPKTFAYTLEWGEMFQPPWAEMELIIEDVCAGLLEICVAAPCAAGVVAVTLDTPSLQFIDVPAGDEAVRAAVFTVQTCDAVTFTAQQPVESPQGPATFGLPLGSVESLPAAPTAAPRQVRVWVSYEAPNANNTATASVTIHCDPIDQDFVIPITANTVQQPQVASVLVLDKSGSMAWSSGIPGKTRNEILHDAAPVYVELLPDDHGIGIVAFDHDPTPVMDVTEVGAGGRAQAEIEIMDHQPNPNGNTAIGDGVEAAHDALGAAGYPLRASVVFTDGHETAGKYISEVENLIDERVFALGLGTAQQLNPVSLNKLVDEREGYLLLTGDLTGDDELRVEKYFSQIQAGVSNEEVVVDPEGSVRPGDLHRIPFTITEADRSATVLLLSQAPWAIDFALETPFGDVIDPVTASALPAVDFSTGKRVHLYRMRFPVPLGAGASVGGWHALLSITDESFKKYLSGERPNSARAAVHGVRYSLNVHARSGLRLRVDVEQKTREPGGSLNLRALLTESGLPVEKRGYVSADVTQPDGTTTRVDLSETRPGIFEAATPAALTGIYPIRCRASGTTRRGNAFTREQLRTPAVWRGGDREPPPPSTDGPDRTPDWCGFVACLLHEDGVARWLERQKVDVAELRRCLESACRGRSTMKLDLEALLPLIEKALRRS
ncbi:MAG: VWA domain-containing protein, partial [Actinomycetota bacterium]|nr:VWA domain-containing protein [Actinomycetota bacterium]